MKGMVFDPQDENLDLLKKQFAGVNCRLIIVIDPKLGAGMSFVSTNVKHLHPQFIVSTCIPVPKAIDIARDYRKYEEYVKSN